MDAIFGRDGLVLEWLQSNQGIIQALASGSAAMFVLTLLAVVLVIIRIPEDYFVRDRRPDEPITRHWVVHGALVVLKNATSVERASKVFKVSAAKLKELNPALTSNVWKGWRLIPDGYSLRLPYRKDRWQKQVAKLEKEAGQ